MRIARTAYGVVPLIWAAAVLLVPAPAAGQRTDIRSARDTRIEAERDRGGGRRPDTRRNRRSNPRASQRPVGPKLIERLMKMPAGQRRRFLQGNKQFHRLPVRQRRIIQQRIRRLSQMSPRQRHLALERYRLFYRLPREKQTRAREIYREWKDLPGGRRRILLDEYDSLRAASPAARRERLGSLHFSETYGPRERSVLKNLVELFPDQPAPDDGGQRRDR